MDMQQYLFIIVFPNQKICLSNDRDTNKSFHQKLLGNNNNFIGDSRLLWHNKVISHITIPHNPLFFSAFNVGLNIFLFIIEDKNIITTLIICIHCLVTE